MNSLTPEYLMDFLKGSFVLKRQICNLDIEIPDLALSTEVDCHVSPSAFLAKTETIDSTSSSRGGPSVRRGDPHISGSEFTIVGEAEFYPESENTIVYYEHGNYTLDGASQEFYQKRYFIFEPGLLKICNSQRQIMHEIPLGSSPETACSFSHTHLCKKDEYLLDFRIVDNTIYMDYKITGPHKNYLINTRLERKAL